MSQYLIDQINATSNITLLPHTNVERVEGGERLERVVLKDISDNKCRMEEFEALFVFIGTRPHSSWLPEQVLRNDKGFVLTGRDAAICDGFARTWKLKRDPMPLETSVPGVFAAGDLRSGAMNRVASAVGEGSMSVKLVHEYLGLA